MSTFDFTVVGRADVKGGLGLRDPQYFLLRNDGDGNFVWYHPLKFNSGDLVGTDCENEAWEKLKKWASEFNMTAEPYTAPIQQSPDKG